MWKSRHATIVAYVALFVALGGSAYAVEGSGSGNAVIKACVSKRSGALSVLRGRKCGSGQEELAWNQKGIAGSPGAAGGRGGAGPAGDPGSQGATGVEGTTGATGATGATGEVDTSDFYTQSQSDARYAPAGLFGDGITPSAGGSSQSCIDGQIMLTAATDDLPANWVVANGQQLPALQYDGLFELIGYTYGGVGADFDVPDLQAADPRGGTSSPAPAYVICTGGTYP